MTVTADELLPAASGPFTRALAFAASDELPVQLAEIMDPERTPERFLPFLAAHESVDLWYDDWPVSRKRRMVDEAASLARLKGTRAAAKAFLPFVDTDIRHKVSYPSRSPVGRIAAGITAINFPNFTARYLLKTPMRKPYRGISVGYSAVGKAVARTPDLTPLRRAKEALVVSKAAETAYSVTFAHRIQKTLDDAPDLGAGFVLGSFKNRKRL